jgi:hypothetical protein
MLRDNIHYVQYTYAGHWKEDFKEIPKMKRHIHSDIDEDDDIRSILQEKYTKEIQQ